jgi:hypothetical protein
MTGGSVKPGRFQVPRELLQVLFIAENANVKKRATVGVRFLSVVIIDDVPCLADVFLHVELLHGYYLSAGTPAGYMTP